MEWQAQEMAQVTLGATAVRELLWLLPHRLPFGRKFTLAGPEQALTFEPGTPGWHAREKTLVISWPKEDTAGFLRGLHVKSETYRWSALAGLELKVVPSTIKDRDGKVVETVG